MAWRVEFDREAMKDVKTLYKKHHHLIARFEDILDTLRRDPLEPTHNFEYLLGNLRGYCSRRLDNKNRVVYRIDGKNVLVYVIQCMGHY